MKGSRWRIWLLWLLLGCGVRLYATAAAAAASHYKVLGVDQSASTEEIRRAYKTLAKKYHPDKNQDDPRAADKFVRISAAHETLADPHKRREYDVEQSWASSSHSRRGYQHTQYQNQRHHRQQGATYVYTMNGRRFYFTEPDFGEEMFQQRHRGFGHQRHTYVDMTSTVLTYLTTFVVIIFFLSMVCSVPKESSDENEPASAQSEGVSPETEHESRTNTNTQQASSSQSSGLRRRRAAAITLVVIHESAIELVPSLKPKYPDVSFVDGRRRTDKWRELIGDDTAVCIALVKRATKAAVLTQEEFVKHSGSVDLQTEELKNFLDRLLDGTGNTKDLERDDDDENDFLAAYR